MYDLTIKPYIGTSEIYGNEKAFTYEGTMKMHFTCVIPTNQIIFHSLGLKLDPTSLKLESTSSSQLTLTNKINHNDITDFDVININGLCVAGAKYTLTVSYTGELSTNLNGFYRSSYIDENGNRK